MAKIWYMQHNNQIMEAKVWNSLPVDLRLLSRSLRTFGHKLKHYLFVSEQWAHLRFFKVALYKFSHYYYYLVASATVGEDCMNWLLGIRYIVRQEFMPGVYVTWHVAGFITDDASNFVHIPTVSLLSGFVKSMLNLFASCVLRFACTWFVANNCYQVTFS